MFSTHFVEVWSQAKLSTSENKPRESPPSPRALPFTSQSSIFIHRVSKVIVKVVPVDRHIFGQFLIDFLRDTMDCLENPIIA